MDERREDFAAAFGEVITAAIDHEVDAVIHAGDLFHTSRPGITAIQTVLTELQRLRDVDIPFLLIVGNHERTHDRNWVELLEEVGLATRLGSEGVQIADTTVYGLDYVPPGQRDDLDYEFSPPATERTVLVGHGLFTPFGHADWDAERILAQSRVAFDLMLVGDDHNAGHAFVGSESIDPNESDETDEQTITENPAEKFEIDRQVPISYAGSTERTAADQRQPRTYSLVNIPPDDDIDPSEHIDRKEIESAREFVYVDIDLHRGDGIDTVKQAIREEVTTLDGAVLKITLMAAEDDPPTPELTDDGTEPAEDEADEPAVHERIPEGPIENVGDELGALITRVSDRRDFFDDSREYQTVEFADIDAAVQERRREMTVSEPADTLLEMVLQTDRYPDSRMKDTAEETVGELLADTSLETFHVSDDSDGAGTAGSTSESEGGQSAETATRIDDTAEDGSPEEQLEELID
jgi:DNA repair exonuclease SbcCD nuclease subunit